MGRAQRNKEARHVARAVAANIEPPVHADRWPWEWVPILGRFVRRRRLWAAAKSEAAHAAAMKKATKKTAKSLTNISQ